MTETLHFSMPNMWRRRIFYTSPHPLLHINKSTLVTFAPFFTISYNLVFPFLHNVKILDCFHNKVVSRCSCFSVCLPLQCQWSEKVPVQRLKQKKTITRQLVAYFEHCEGHGEAQVWNSSILLIFCSWWQPENFTSRPNITLQP